MGNRKRLFSICLLFSMTIAVSAQTDSTTVSNDSITWSQELEGVTVKAQRQLIKQDIDRIGYDVQADEESKTLTVLDLLRKVPMVTVDGEENIKVKGNSSYKIYKNGHYDPSLSKNAKEILKSMPASMVKRIEVITDPGAREDAEGVNAILNIVMMDGRSFQRHPRPPVQRNRRLADMGAPPSATEAGRVTNAEKSETTFRLSPRQIFFRSCRGLFYVFSLPLSNIKKNSV